MKPFFISICSLLILVSGYSISDCYGQTEEMAVMSYNIRYDNPGDSLNSWPYRKEALTNQIKMYNPGILGIQEGMPHQVEYLDDHLSNYDYIGIGRDQGGDSNEFTAIYFKTTKYELVVDSDSTIWLSPSRSKNSVGWDAALPRIVTWGKFLNKKTGESFYVFNTHFDHRGEKARRESAKLITSMVKKVAKESPVVLTGDFNTKPGSKPYQTITSTLIDGWENSVLEPVGPSFTGSGFDVAQSLDNTARIDYIFVNDRFTVQKIEAITTFRKGRYLSDHLPVFSILTRSAQ